MNIFETKLKNLDYFPKSSHKFIIESQSSITIMNKKEDQTRLTVNQSECINFPNKPITETEIHYSASNFYDPFDFDPFLALQNKNNKADVFSFKNHDENSEISKNPKEKKLKNPLTASKDQNKDLFSQIDQKIIIEQMNTEDNTKFYSAEDSLFDSLEFTSEENQRFQKT